ncbi:MAG: hypothetical protein MHPSP_000231 [Paramarteilia canceri]
MKRNQSNHLLNSYIMYLSQEICGEDNEILKESSKKESGSESKEMVKVGVKISKINYRLQNKAIRATKAAWKNYFKNLNLKKDLTGVSNIDLESLNGLKSKSIASLEEDNCGFSIAYPESDEPELELENLVSIPNIKRLAHNHSFKTDVCFYLRNIDDLNDSDESCDSSFGSIKSEVSINKEKMFLFFADITYYLHLKEINYEDFLGRSSQLFTNIAQ